MNAFQRNIKRIGDCLIAFIALIIFSPLFLYCYIAVKREDGGPAIFKQERIGRFGKPFNIYKFRSMRLDAEKFGPALYKGRIFMQCIITLIYNLVILWRILCRQKLRYPEKLLLKKHLDVYKRQRLLCGSAAE